MILSSFQSDVLEDDWARGTTQFWRGIENLDSCYNYPLYKESLPKIIDLVIQLGKGNAVYDEIMVRLFLQTCHRN